MNENPAVVTPTSTNPALMRPIETVEQKYARQTRNATTFIAWCVAIFTALALIGLILVGVQIAKVNSQLGQLNGGVTNSNCLSQGGTDPSC